MPVQIPGFSVPTSATSSNIVHQESTKEMSKRKIDVEQTPNDSVISGGSKKKKKKKKN